MPLTTHPSTVFAIAVVLLAGCEKAASPTPQASPQTGAEQVAKTFFDSLMQQDWSAAYSTLDGGSRRWCGKAEFGVLGLRYREQIGFTPTELNVSVTETNDNATAVAVFRDASGNEPKQFRDGTALQKTAAGWAVVLRKNFGRDSPAAKSQKH
jgi:hypothetical protein